MATFLRNMFSSSSNNGGSGSAAAGSGTSTQPRGDEARQHDPGEGRVQGPVRQDRDPKLRIRSQSSPICNAFKTFDSSLAVAGISLFSSPSPVPSSTFTGGSVGVSLVSLVFSINAEDDPFPNESA